MTISIETRMAKAKTSLVLEHPFVGSIAMNMPIYLDESVGTAATNYKSLIFAPSFVDKLTDEELKFLLAHECMHPMLQHNFRRGGRDPRKWNQAGDYVINQLLTDEGIGKMPEVGLLDKAIYDAGGGSADGIYKILPDTEEGDGNDPLDDCQDGEGSPAEIAQQEAEWKVKVAQAAQAAKMMGKMSAGLQRIVGEVLDPKVDWREVMQRFVEKCKADTRSFARPNRRFLPQGMYLPSMSGEALGEVVFAIDCSGSIDDKLLAQFAAEVRTVKEDSNPSKIHLVYFDSEVSHHGVFTRDDDLHVEMHGGGGTAFSPVFKYISEQNIEPVACVFLTDLCCNDFGDAPSYPVLWVSTESGTAPFGEIVLM
jgi:predicted metal-dependent peptidase